MKRESALEFIRLGLESIHQDSHGGKQFKKENHMRKEFQMSEEQLSTILDSCKPTPVMYLSGGQPMFDSPQENANRAWAELGRKLGFNSMTVEPVAEKGNRCFTAETV